jgi:hypothetical protein
MRALHGFQRLVPLATAAALAAPAATAAAQPITYSASVNRSFSGPITSAQGATRVSVTGAQSGIGNGGTSALAGLAHAGPVGLGAMMQSSTTILPGLTLFEVGDSRASFLARDLVFRGPTNNPFTASLAMAIDGFVLLSHPDNSTGALVNGGVRVSVDFANTGGFFETGVLRVGSGPFDNLAQGLLDASHFRGTLTPAVGTGGVALDGIIQTSSFVITPGNPTHLEVTLEAFAASGGTSFGAPSQSTWALSDFSNTLTFPAGPVFNLPPGYTVDSPSLGIVDNRFIYAQATVPEPSTALLLGGGLAALGAAARRRRHGGSTPNSRAASLS